MYFLKVLVEHPVYKIEQEFYYLSEKEVNIYSRVLINFKNQHIYGFVVSSIFKEETVEELKKETGLNLKFIDEIIDEKPVISDELFSLANDIKERYLYPLIGVILTMLPKSLKPKKSSEKAPKIKYSHYYYLDKNKLNLNSLNKLELKLIDKFKYSSYLNKNELKQTKTLTTLINKNIIIEKKEEAFRGVFNKIFYYDDKINLTEEQEKVYKSIKNNEKKVTLLKGVTGSGKTEIYIKLVEDCINSNKSAIVLVPEISLTPLMISRFLSYFNKENIAIFHSSLSDGERYDEYRKIKEGKVKIAIGTRSAIFLPFTNLGLIIIDEENDQSYKENDQGLLYDAIDIAILRLKYFDGKVVLGSATPSIESNIKAKNGIYNYEELKNRYNKQELPLTTLVDRNDNNQFKISSVFSLDLIKKIKETISKHQQVMLLINNKGYSRTLFCRECGHVFKCEKCGYPLIYHKEDNTLRCHHCDLKIKKPNKCPNCNSHYFGMNGFGIEKVEEEFKKIFNIKYLLLDGDRTNESKKIADILYRFSQKEALVLIGTQIIAKGHDFKNVTLVGIINADTLLNYPSYKSTFNTFSLINQAIGRCGRGESKGEAIVQTSSINNYAIKYGIEQNYDAFFKEEIKYRKLLNNPPYFNNSRVILRSKNKTKLMEISQNFKKLLREKYRKLIVLGPSRITFINKIYVISLTLKAKSFTYLNSILKEIIGISVKSVGIDIKVDVNCKD